METSEERRNRRSADPTVATKFQLEQVLHDFDLDSVVLADEAGRLIQSAGRDESFQSALARETPRLAIGSHCRLLFARLSKVKPSIRANQISACEFRNDGKRYYVATVGAMTTMRDVGMYRAILGIRRIQREAVAA